MFLLRKQLDNSFLWCYYINITKKGGRVVKRITTLCLSIISIFSLVYFTSKYYYNSYLSFDESSYLLWGIIVLIMLITLCIGVYNSIQINKITKQNKDLTSIILQLVENQDDTCLEILQTLKNSREIELDIFQKLNKGE
jgi:energy-coupling factor transporter transmembrane protein EcfT